MANEYLRQSDLRSLNAFSPEEDQERIYAEQLADQGGIGPSIEQELARTKDPRARDALLAELESRGGSYEQAPSEAPRQPSGRRRYKSLDDIPADAFDDLGKDLDYDKMLAQYKTTNEQSEAPKTGFGNSLKRGAVVAMQQMPQLAYGLFSGMAAITESAVGEGGVATAAKNWSIGKYGEWEQKIQANSAENDSLTASYDKAKNGDFGALVDWLGYGVGYGLSQGAQMLATGGIGSIVGKVALKGAAEKMALGMVEKKVAEGVGREAAVSAVASELGQLGAIGASAYGMEGGEIFGDMAKANQGHALTGDQIARGLGATLMAGSLEFVGDKLGYDTLMGKYKFGFGKMEGLSGRAARGGAAAVLNAPAEGGTEYFQTGLEEWGKGNESNMVPWNQSEKAQIGAIDAAGLGAVGGGAHGIIGGILSSPTVDDAINKANESINLNQSLDQAVPGYSPAVTDYLQNGIAQPEPSGDFGVMVQNEQLPEFERQLNADRDAALAGILQGQKREEVDTSIDPVRGYVEEQRRLATPAAMEFVRQFENGAITPDQIQKQIDLEQSRLGKTSSDIRIENAAAESTGQDMSPPASRDLRTQQMQNESMALSATQAQRTQSQQLADNEAGQFSQNRTSQQQTADVQAATTAPTIGRVTQDTRDLAAKVPGNPQISDVTVETMAGKMQNTPKLVAHTVQKLGKMLGRRVVFFSGGGIDGTVFRDKNDNRIFVNADASVNPIRVLGHEMMHRLKTESPAAYASLRKALREGGIITDEMLADYDRDYNGEAYKGLDEAGAKARRDAVLAEIKAGKSEHLLEEMLSDLNGNRFMEAGFWGNVFQKIEEQEGREKAKGIIAKLREALTLLISKLQKALAGSKEFDADKQILENLQQVRSALEDAFATYMGDLKKAGNRLEEMAGEGGAEGAAVQNSAQRAESSHEIRDQQSGDRAINGARLQALRSAAARLENPKSGTFLRVTEDGRAIATGQKGTRIPDSFRRFAEDNGLTFQAERRIPKYDRSDMTSGGNRGVGARTESMPIHYRSNGAMYFGEMGGEALDRTDNAAFSPRRNDPAWNDALKMWLAMSSHNELFKYPKSDKEKLQDIFAEVMPEAKVAENQPLDDRDQRYDVVQKWLVTVGDGRTATIYQDKNGDVWVNVLGLKSGKSEGAAVYSALLNYTHNNMLRMVGDPLGVSDLAIFRRTENMLASALKFGTTDHMAPADEQARPEYFENQMGHLPGVTDKFEPIQWSDGDHLGNLTNLLYSSYSNVKSFVPEIENVTYNFASRRFEWIDSHKLVTKPEWEVLSERLRNGLAGIASNSERIGSKELAGKSGEDPRSATLQRAALTNALLRESSEEVRGSLLAEVRSKLQSEGLDEIQNDLSYSPKRTSDVGHKRTKAGEYVGAPPGMTSAKLGALRNRLRALTKEGEPGRFWYEDSSDLILAAAEGDKALAEKIAGLLAIYSPQAMVSANTSMGLKALYQWMEGNPIRVRFGHQDRKAQAWMDGTIAEEDALQIKTGNFFRNLMRKIDEERYGYDQQGATIDMWMARVFGYGSKAIGSEARYLFAERETKQLAKELGWEPQQVQAALWVAIKSRIEAIADEAREIGKKKGWLERKVTKSGGKENISWPPLAEHKEKYEALILKMALAQEADPSGIIGAAYHFGTALRERVGQISWEAMPGKTTGVLPGIFNAPLEQQLEYLVAMDKALRDENGQDLIAKQLGLPVIGTAMGPSAWQMNVGAGAQTEVAVATDRDQDNKRVSVTPPAKKLLNMYAAIRGYVLNQEAVVWHYPIYKAAKKDANGVQIDFGRDPTHDEVVSLYNAIHEVSGRDDWAPAYVPGVGVRILNFSDVANLEFHKLIKKAADAAEIPDYRAQTFMSDGDYISNDWVKNPDGKQYKEVFNGQVSKLDARGEGRSDLQGWVEGFLRPRAERVNQEFADRYGWAKLSPARSDGSGSAAGGSLSRSAGEGSRPGSVSATGIHYSQEKRSFLDSGYFGRGTKSEELERVMDAPDERIKHRIYFYVNEGRGIQPENGVGSHAHKYDLTNLYDLTADRDDLYAKLWRNKNSLESAILDAGYDGWTGGGIAILLGKRSIVPEYVGQFVKPEVAEREYSEKSPYGKLQQAVVKNNSLPGGEMSGSDWKRLMPKLMPEVDVSHLEDDKRYYKDQIVKRPDATDQGGVSLSTARAQTETPEFKKWFGDSKVVDAEGKPLVVYHGGPKWDVADMGGRGAIWASDEYTDAVSYADQYNPRSGNTEVKPLYVKMDNPLDLRDADVLATVFGEDSPSEHEIRRDRSFVEEAIKYAKANGHDGLIHHDSDVQNRPGGTSYVVFDPAQLKLAKPTGYESQFMSYGHPLRAEGNNGQFNGSNPDIRMSTQRWYYSNLSRQIEVAPDKVFGPAKQVKAWLQSNAGKLGIKADEIQWTGINDWLDLQQRVSKADVLAYLDANGVQVKEVVHNDSDPEALAKKAKDLHRQIVALEDKAAVLVGKTDSMYPKSVRDKAQEDIDELMPKIESLRKDYSVANREAKAAIDEQKQTKYSQYVLPGGSNYKELLLTLPKKKATIKPDGEKFAVMLPDGRRFGLYSSLADAESALNRTDGQIGPNFQSQHWSDTKNVLAHIRFNDRTDADGARVLFLEELQGDWQQEYRKQSDLIADAVDKDFLGIVKRMEADGVLEVDCD